MNAAARELTHMGNVNLDQQQIYKDYVAGYKRYRARKSRILSKVKRVKVMGMSRSTNQLKDEDVYSIHYLHKVEKLTPAELAEQFPASEMAIKAIIEGKARKQCYENFVIVESLLNR